MTQPARRLTGTVALVLVVALTAACGSDSGGDTTAGPAEGPTTTVPEDFPLTGLPVDGDDDEARAVRPALTVKVENSPAARPQSGLDKADVVYEELTEGGITRFLAVFQSQDADAIGPIRSVRPTDPDVVWPLGGLIAYSGGTPKFVQALREAPVQDVGFDVDQRPYDTTHKGKRPPHSTYSSTDKLYGLARPATKAPPPIVRYSDDGATFGDDGQAVTQLVLPIGFATKAGYEYDAESKTWKRSTNGTPATMEDGTQLAPSTVIVQFVDYVPSAGDVDPNGEQVFEADVVGSGEAWVLAQGKLVKGRWSKAGSPAITELFDGNGARLAIPPGQTHVAFVPTNVRTKSEVR